MNFNTSNQTYRQLMGNGLLYHVPRFQRDYSWTEEEWDDLWRDIEGVLASDGEPAHYMGYLVLQSNDNKTFDVIDGQQRITTLSILVLAVLKNLQRLIDEDIDPTANRARQEQLRGSFIGYLNPVTLIAQSKLTLNRNNNHFYQDYLVPLEKLPQRNLKATEHALRKSFEWFYERVQRSFGQNKDGATLAQIIDTLSDKLFFTVITVADELNAFKVFETLNARGVRLSSTDLLKNYLFSTVHADGRQEAELQVLEQRWESVVGKLGSENFPDFLRSHWNSRHRFVRHSELFKTIRDQVRQKGEVFRLMREMEEDADIYAALPNPEDTLWNPEERPSIRELKMFNVRQPYPLLMTAKRRLPPASFTALLRFCSVISFRYNVIGGLATSEQERVYTEAADKLAQGHLRDLAEICRELRTVYPSDEQFRTAFSEKQLRTSSARNRRIVKYILFRIERHLSGAKFDADSEQYSIEHILPEQPSDGWTQFSDEEAERSVFRLGNFALLRAGENRDLGQAEFSAKKEAYARSEFATTRQIADENSEWNIERLASRQRWMASQASSIWRVDQLA